MLGKLRLPSLISGAILSSPSPAGWTVLVPLGVFLFVYPWAMLLMSLDLMPFGMEWMSSLLLAMLGVASGGWLWLNFGGRGALAGAFLFVLGLALEYVGVTTGLPFGAYRYTGVLVPGLPGGVPLAIGFAWVFIVICGLFTAKWLLPSSLPVLVLCLAGAGLAVGLDLLLEPVAFHVKNYWQWLDTGGGYYGVPWLNFAAWFVAAALMNLLLAAVLPIKAPPLSSPSHLPRARLRWLWLPVGLFGLNTVLFGVVNVAHGMLWPGLVCLCLVLLLFAAYRRERAISLL